MRAWHVICSIYSNSIVA